MAHGISERDVEAARALVAVLGDSRWDAVALARGYLAAVEGADDMTAARVAYEQGLATLRGSRELIARARNEGFVAVLPPRKKLGSAENPVTKLFPGTITGGEATRRPRHHNLPLQLHRPPRRGGWDASSGRRLELE